MIPTISPTVIAYTFAPSTFAYPHDTMVSFSPLRSALSAAANTLGVSLMLFNPARNFVLPAGEKASIHSVVLASRTANSVYLSKPGTVIVPLDHEPDQSWWDTECYDLKYSTYQDTVKLGCVYLHSVCAHSFDDAMS